MEVLIMPTKSGHRCIDWDCLTSRLSAIISNSIMNDRRKQALKRNRILKCFVIIVKWSWRHWTKYPKWKIARNLVALAILCLLWKLFSDEYKTVITKCQLEKFYLNMVFACAKQEHNALMIWKRETLCPCFANIYETGW